MCNGLRPQGHILGKNSARAGAAEDADGTAEGVDKPRGIDMVLRSMGPQVIAMDEVTSKADCEALLRAAWCGVRLIATAHADSVMDLRQRTVYRPLVQTGLFSQAAVLDANRSWHLEEVEA